MTYDRGDVVLVEFRYTDNAGSKRRPAYILSNCAFHAERRMAIIGVITSKLGRSFSGDWVIQDWEAAGLRIPSRATVILRTVNLGLIEQTIGQLSSTDLKGLLAGIRHALNL